MHTRTCFGAALLAAVLTACGGGGGGATPPATPAPTLTSVTPPLGSTLGGTQATLTGTGFTANSAGTNTVTFGGAAASSVNTVSDTLITCVTPPGPVGPAGVSVTNTNGTATLSAAYAFFEPIFAADGGGNPAPPSWDFFAVDPATGVAYLIGPIGFGVAGMDFGPGGVLYATTAPGGAGGKRNLITINPVTGAGTLVGPLDDTLLNNYAVPDCSFYLGALYGTDGPGGSFLSINVATGAVTNISPYPSPGPGGAFAVDAASVNVYFMTLDVGPLVTVNPPTAFFTPGPPLSGFVLASGRMTAAAFHQGVLYAVDAGPNAGPRHLLTVNPATGVMTPIGPPLPPLVSAIASRTR